MTSRLIDPSDVSPIQRDPKGYKFYSPSIGHIKNNIEFLEELSNKSTSSLIYQFGNKPIELVEDHLIYNEQFGNKAGQGYADQNWVPGSIGKSTPM